MKFFLNWKEIPEEEARKFLGDKEFDKAVATAKELFSENITEYGCFSPKGHLTIQPK